MTVDFTNLDRSVDAACEEIDRLRAQRDELLAALKALVALIEGDGTVQRDGVTGAAFAVCLNDRGGKSWEHGFNAAEAAIAKAEGR